LARLLTAPEAAFTNGQGLRAVAFGNVYEIVLRRRFVCIVRQPDLDGGHVQATAEFQTSDDAQLYLCRRAATYGLPVWILRCILARGKEKRRRAWLAETRERRVARKAAVS